MPVENGERAIEPGLTWDDVARWIAEQRTRTETLEAQLEFEISHRCLGGTPPGYHAPGAWGNQAIAPPESASDESAPPLKRGLS